MELMTDFYDKWLGGNPKREAFRIAQQNLKKKYDNFSQWGGFIMIGK